MVHLARTAQAAAEQWQTTSDSIRQAEDTARRAKSDVELLHERLVTVAAELCKCVGPNLPTKAFKVDNGTVIVDLKAGIRFLEFQKTD